MSANELYLNLSVTILQVQILQNNTHLREYSANYLICGKFARIIYWLEGIASDYAKFYRKKRSAFKFFGYMKALYMKSSHFIMPL